MDATAQWLAPVATMAAALMTAANLGARVTGWGFVVFTLGSICWVIVGLQGHQDNLMITNGLLTLVNAVGVWRWLGRQARYESVGASAEAAGVSPRLPSVFAATAIAGRDIVDDAGATLGEAVEAIIDCRTGTIRHIVVRFGGVGGVGEQIVAIPLADVRLGVKSMRTHLSPRALAALPRLDEDQWPRLLRAPGSPAPPQR